MIQKEDYMIITQNQVYRSEPEKVAAEIEEKRKVLGLNGKHLCHFFETVYTRDRVEILDVDEAIQQLAIKDAYDLVQFCIGNNGFGFVAYYNGVANGFEVID